MQIVDKLINFLLVIFLSAMSLVVAANVFCRFLLDFSIYWADELAQILLVWLTFIGAALAVKEKSHYVLHFLSRKLKDRGRKIVVIFQRVVTLFAIGALLYYSAEVSLKIGLWVMPATEISRSIVYSACPVGCALMLFYTIRDWRDWDKDPAI